VPWQETWRGNYVVFGWLVLLVGEAEGGLHSGWRCDGHLQPAQQGDGHLQPRSAITTPTIFEAALGPRGGRLPAHRLCSTLRHPPLVVGRRTAIPSADRGHYPDGSGFAVHAAGLLGQFLVVAVF
jgi:hypothetical protein